jgi:hypothetical protein
MLGLNTLERFAERLRFADRPRLSFTSLAPYGSAVPGISRAWRTAVALARSCASRSRRATALSSSADWDSISGGGLAAISSSSSFARTFWGQAPDGPSNGVA